MKAIDLFCGAGGASLGIERAGFELIAGIDKDKTAIDTHRKNLDTSAIQMDLAEVDKTKLPHSAREADYVHGSPPCQGFSLSGKGKDPEAEINRLVFRFIEWVQELSPRAVTMENVVGMKTQTPPYYISKLKTKFNKAGYNARQRVINAANYGVPQTRNRLIFVAYRKDVKAKPRFPKPTHSKTETTNLDGDKLEEWVGVEDTIDLENIETKAQGKTSNSAWRDGSKPSPTCTTGGNIYVRGDGIDRALKPAEYAMLQTFPPNYEFSGETKEEKYRQIGNAVPPLLQKKIATQVKQYLEK